MKFNKLLIVSLFLLAILTIGAVSAADENITESTGDILCTDNSRDVLTVDATDNSELEASPADFAELDSLVANTASGKTLMLEKDYIRTTDGGIYVSEAITIDGQGHTIDGNSKSNFFFTINNKNVVLKNINFINGGPNSVVGGSSSGSRGFSIYNCSFANCTGFSSLWYGNAYNCSFVNCNDTLGSGGGAIYYGNAYNCSFVNCKATSGSGGAIYCGNAYNCSFVYCYASLSGGAICNGNAMNSYFSNCSTKSSNAAIVGGTATNCTFVECQASAAINSVRANDITYGSYAYIYVYGESNAGYVNVTVNGQTKKVTPSSYGSYVSFAGLAVGTYQAKVTYSGSAYFDAQELPFTITVNKASNPIKSVAQPATKVGYGENVTIKVDMLNGKINGNVWYSISDKNKTKLIIDKMSINKGVATTSIPSLSMGKYTLHVYFAGNAHYNAQTIKKTFNVVKGTPIASVNVTNWAIDSDPTIKVKVNNVNGNIWFTVSDENKTKILTDKIHIEDRWAIASIPGLTAGKYYLHIYYAGNVHYNAQKMKSSFEVTKISPEMTVSKTTVNGQTVLTATVPNDARGNINFEVNGSSYKAQIVKGEALVTLPDMEPGTYKITSSYCGNFKYLPETKTCTIKIK